MKILSEGRKKINTLGNKIDIENNELKEKNISYDNDNIDMKNKNPFTKEENNNKYMFKIWKIYPNIDAKE